jgi:mannose-6-phosphate isomerase
LKPYPLRFKPVLQERVWGGRALERFGLELPEGHIGEGWMIGDHPNGTTTIENGELAGLGLDELRQRYGKEFFGPKGNSNKTGRFPLLLKLLDCEDDLSIQVHPNDDYAGLPEGELGKTEMWYVLDAKPDAKIIYGLKPGVTREHLMQAIKENRIIDSMQEFPVSAGDSFYIPAGTVHALCSGVLVAEIQQNSDTTYRLYDYGRPGLDGKPRKLHIEDSLNVIAFEGSGATRMTTGQQRGNEWLTLARSPFFVVEKGIVDREWILSAEEESFTLLVCCEGNGTLKWDNDPLSMKPGDCLLLPAALGGYTLEGNLTVLRCYLP